MTVRPIPQCLSCAHWVSPLMRDDEEARGRQPKQTCSAYPLPESIPDKIWLNQADHREPFNGDHGIQWEAKGERKFPESALNLATA